MIAERSQCKQENAIDSIFDNYPSVVENLEHEETYFKFLNEEIVKLDKAVHDVWICSRKLNRSAQGISCSCLSTIQLCLYDVRLFTLSKNTHFSLFESDRCASGTGPTIDHAGPSGSDQL